MFMKPSPLISHRKSDTTRLMPQHFLQSHKIHLQDALLMHMSLKIPDISKLWGGKAEEVKHRNKKCTTALQKSYKV